MLTTTAANDKKQNSRMRGRSCHDRFRPCLALLFLFGPSVFSFGCTAGGTAAAAATVASNHTAAAAATAGGAVGAAESSGSSSMNYLYDAADAYPVREYKLSASAIQRIRNAKRVLLDQGQNIGEAVKQEQERIIRDFMLRPEFLYGNGSSDNGHSSSKPRVVEFYAPWCPHCQHFRDRYVRLARRVQRMARDLKPRSRPPPGNHDRGGGGDDGDEQRPIEFYAVSCQAHKYLCRSYGANRYPKIYLFPPGASNYTQELTSGALDPYGILSEFGLIDEDAAGPDTASLLLQQEGMNSYDEDTIGTGGTGSGISNSTDRRTGREIYDDAFASLAFLLKGGVYGSDGGPLAGYARVSALSDWLELLGRAVPFAWRPVRRMVTDLQRHFVAITASEDALIQIVDRHAPPDRPLQWSSYCTRGGRVGKGYTCGLWTLLHVVTVGVVEWNQMMAIGGGGGGRGDDRLIRAEDAAQTVRNVIAHFFGCDECRTNFVRAYDACAHDRCRRLKLPPTTTASKRRAFDTWMQLPLWLYETHNGVNIRLLHESYERRHGAVTPTPNDTGTHTDNADTNTTATTTKTTDSSPSLLPSRDDILRVEWPSRTVCPACWQPSTSRGADQHNENGVSGGPAVSNAANAANTSQAAAAAAAAAHAATLAASNTKKAKSYFDDEPYNHLNMYKFLRIEYWPEDSVTRQFREELFPETYLKSDPMQTMDKEDEGYHEYDDDDDDYDDGGDGYEDEEDEEVTEEEREHDHNQQHQKHHRRHHIGHEDERGKENAVARAAARASGGEAAGSEEAVSRTSVEAAAAVVPADTNRAQRVGNVGPSQSSRLDDATHNGNKDEHGKANVVQTKTQASGGEAAGSEETISRTSVEAEAVVAAEMSTAQHVGNDIPNQSSDLEDATRQASRDQIERKPDDPKHDAPHKRPNRHNHRSYGMYGALSSFPIEQLYSILFQVLALSIIVCMPAGWYRKKRRLARTGYRKKHDSSVYYKRCSKHNFTTGSSSVSATNGGCPTIKRRPTDSFTRHFNGIL